MELRHKRSMLALFLLPVLLLVLTVAIATSRWPLVGDTSLMHYVVFLIERGKIPYAQIFDINMPGTYLFEYLGMKLFGADALGWRLYDLFLCGCLTAAMVVVAGPGRRWAGLFAGGLFFLLHARDGMAELGQRDLTGSVLSMLACAALAASLRRPRDRWLVSVAGLCFGLTLLVKPPLALAGLAMLAAIVLHKGLDSRQRLRRVLLFAAGAASPLAVCGAVLWRWGAPQAFLDALRLLVPYHATLGRRPLAYFVLHPLPSSLLPLAIVLLVLLALRVRSAADWQADRSRGPLSALLAGMFLVGLVSLASQGKALPYHRYPANAFFLLLAVLWFGWALDGGKWARYCGLLGCALAAFWLAPQSTVRTLQYRAGKVTLISTLEQDLRERGGPALDGKVQCIDFTSGCLNALYDTRIVQATGTLYDCYLFGPDASRAVQESRRQFLEAYTRDRPQWLVVTNQDCYRPNSYAKLDRWAEFAVDLRSNYSLDEERVMTEPVHWASTPTLPNSYRIYRLNGSRLHGGEESSGTRTSRLSR